jgi:hypothetical protein
MSAYSTINRNLYIVNNQVNENNIALRAIQSGGHKCLTPNYP